MKVKDVIEFTYGKGLVQSQELESPGLILKISTLADESIDNDDLFCYWDSVSKIIKYAVAHKDERKKAPNKPCYQLLCGNRKVWIYHSP